METFRCTKKIGRAKRFFAPPHYAPNPPKILTLPGQLAAIQGATERPYRPVAAVRQNPIEDLGGLPVLSLALLAPAILRYHLGLGLSFGNHLEYLMVVMGPPLP